MKKAILEICHVSKSFRHQSILSDGNMTFYEGELICVGRMEVVNLQYLKS